MLDADAIEVPFDPPHVDTVYAHYLETCRRACVEPVSRERALGLMQEWGEVLTGRPVPMSNVMKYAIAGLGLLLALALPGSPVAVAQPNTGAANATESAGTAPPIRRDVKRVSGLDVSYPRSAIRLGVSQGKVKARARIDSGGNVIEVVIVNAEPPGVFDRAVTDALKTWKYTPDSQGYTAEYDIVLQLRDASGRPMENAVGAPK